MNLNDVFSNDITLDYIKLNELKTIFAFNYLNPDNTLGFNLGPKTSLCDRPNSLDKSRLWAV